MAGSKTNAFENAVLQLIYNNAAIANIGNIAGLQPSGVAGNLYIALFTTVPGDDSPGVEATYTGYARISVARTPAGLTIVGNVCSNTEIVSFYECTAGNETITGMAIMTALAGGDMLFWADLDQALNVSPNITPEFAAGAILITEDNNSLWHFQST